MILVEGNVWLSTDKSIFIIDPKENQTLHTLEIPASSLVQVGSSVWATYALKKSVNVIDIDVSFFFFFEIFHKPVKFIIFFFF